jgi:azurin
LLQTSPGSDHDLFLTLNRLDDPFEGFSSYQPRDKVLLPHPMLADLRRPIVTKRNPYGKAIADARAIKIAAARNLMFDQSVLEVEAGEPIRLTFDNPDAVPHNWALIRPGKLQAVGQLCNQLIADPEAVARPYIPDTDDVLAFTDVVEPYSEYTIYFNAPQTPGRYPFLCTFPGHWMVMNGIMLVKEK